MVSDEINNTTENADSDELNSLSELETMSMDFVDQRLDSVDYVRNLIEGILLMSSEPLEISRIAKSLGIKKAVAEKASEILVEDYQTRGILIQEIGDGLQLGTNPDIAEHLERFFQIERRRRVSRAGLQTLSIIAYNQPITRAEVESFRGGINSGGVLQSLLERDLVKIAGRKETPGNPYLYSVSDAFLKYFGLKTIEELKEKLPAIEDKIASDGDIAQLKLKDLGISHGEKEMPQDDDTITNDLLNSLVSEDELNTDMPESIENNPDETKKGSDIT
ncbi:SMC-Scp complex subunit ScpB [bacterium]|nr:SMC-Scp complex subunit ScpB [bacterium]